MVDARTKDTLGLKIFPMWGLTCAMMDRHKDKLSKRGHYMIGDDELQEEYQLKDINRFPNSRKMHLK